MNAIIYCENEFGKIDGKVANGLVRHSKKYEILGIIDSTKSGLDAGELLDGVKNGIPIFSNIEAAIDCLGFVPDHFIYGIAPLESTLSTNQRKVFFIAMEKGMNIVNGMAQYLTEDLEFIEKAKEHNVTIKDIRKPRPRNEMPHFTGKIFNIQIPIVAVLGTDCAVGKRTTALLLQKSLIKKGIKAIFISTGQTGVMQGAKYGVAIDILSSGYATGAVENAIVSACENENPDILIVEGQGALSHPAFLSTCAILKGAQPDAIILQHAPNRKTLCDFPHLDMPSISSEIKQLESFSNVKVIAITINHENMKTNELVNVIQTYEAMYHRPTTDVLKYGSKKLVRELLNTFPSLKKQLSKIHQLQG